MQGILADIEHMLARGRMDLPLSLCFAAKRGDDLLLHHLLRRGSDPNEMDDNGRTAMVLISYLYIRTCTLVPYMAFAYETWSLFCMPFLLSFDSILQHRMEASTAHSYF